MVLLIGYNIDVGLTVGYISLSSLHDEETVDESTAEYDAVLPEPYELTVYESMLYGSKVDVLEVSQEVLYSMLEAS